MPLTCGDVSGPGRARTDDHRGVSAVLYQLSYRPQDTANGVNRRPRTAQTTDPDNSLSAAR